MKAEMNIDWTLLTSQDVAEPLFFGTVGMTLGFLLFFKADWIGDNLVGHLAGGHLVTARTPGCLLKPFGLLLIIGGGYLIWDGLSQMTH